MHLILFYSHAYFQLLLKSLPIHMGYVCDKTIDWLIDWLIEWLIDWLIDWLIEQLL